MNNTFGKKGIPLRLRFLKATLATYNAAEDKPEIRYGPVDTSLVPPRARTYGKKADAGAAKAPAASASPAPVAAPAPAAV